MSEEGGGGEGEGSEALPLLSYTLTYVSLADSGRHGRGGWGLRNSISDVIHTYIRQSRNLKQTVTVWVPITDALVYIRE